MQWSLVRIQSTLHKGKASTATRQVRPGSRSTYLSEKYFLVIICINKYYTMITLLEGPTLENLILIANELKIKLENVLDIFKENDKYIMIYYK